MGKQSEHSSSPAWDVADVTDGGERVTHLWPNDCYFAHLSIYRFAAGLCDGGIVLDAGCGTGYGSAYLAAHGARRVHAIDVSEKAVTFSRDHFARPNLDFRAMDVERIKGFPARSFDLIFSSNVLEHVADVPAFLRAAWRLMKSDGILLVVVPPIIGPKPRAIDQANPYHLNSWSPHQWHFALRHFWTSIDCYRHSFERSDVTLDFGNSPEDVVISEADFAFQPVELEQIYRLPTFSAVFLARQPRPARELPRRGAPVAIIDNSVSRPGPRQGDSSSTGRWQRLRAGGTKVFRRIISSSGA